VTLPVSRITVRPAPRREPPYDDEIPARHLHLIGPHDQQLPFPDPPEQELPPVGPRTVDRGGLVDPAIWARRLLTALLESLGGRRPLRQLAGHLSPAVHHGLLAGDPERLVRQRAWARGAVIRSVRVCEPAAGVAEVAAVVQAGARVRAVAARLENFDGRWRCTRLQIG
jgi:hypothetical protein